MKFIEIRYLAVLFHTSKEPLQLPRLLPAMRSALPLPLPTCSATWSAEVPEQSPHPHPAAAPSALRLAVKTAGFSLSTIPTASQLETTLWDKGAIDDSSLNCNRGSSWIFAAAPAIPLEHQHRPSAEILVPMPFEESGATWCCRSILTRATHSVNWQAKCCRHLRGGYWPATSAIQVMVHVSISYCPSIGSKALQYNIIQHRTKGPLFKWDGTLMVSVECFLQSAASTNTSKSNVSHTSPTSNFLGTCLQKQVTSA